VGPFGDSRARLLVVGLAPGLHGANRTGRPFTGDHAGLLLYRTLHRFGFASAPESVSAADGLRLVGCRITNAVKCWPPQNKPLPEEVARCNTFLRVELETLATGSAILALGSIAHGAVLRALGLRPAGRAFAHGARHALPGGLSLHDSYHCSRYNTQTKRLTEAMFVHLVGRVAAELGA
jgi:uracil-DNA glycosylase family 4